MNTLEKVSNILHANKLRLVTAESCTGGWIAKMITDLPGSSSIFDRGFVTYSNQAKHEMLTVSNKTIEIFGAVSEQVVAEMATGALSHSDADIALSVSGIAGPNGGTDEKPVGMVCFAWAMNGSETKTKTTYFDGDRESIREQAVEYALSGVKKIVS